jgi:hypothetical protein
MKGEAELSDMASQAIGMAIGMATAADDRADGRGRGQGLADLGAMARRMAFVALTTLAAFLVQRAFDAMSKSAKRVPDLLRRLSDWTGLGSCRELLLQISIIEKESECWVKASDSAKAVIHHMEKHSGDMAGVHRLRELFMASFYTPARSYGNESPSKADVPTKFVVDQDRWIPVRFASGAPAGHVRLLVAKDHTADKARTTNVSIDVRSRRGLQDAQRFVAECVAERERDLAAELHSCRCTFVLTAVRSESGGGGMGLGGGGGGSGGSGELKYAQVPFESSKTFDNMFFPGKRRLMERLDHFTSSRSHYERIGMPYTLGILLHGIPGSGKTSCIKSIANHLNRHVIIVPTSLVTSKDILSRIFLDERVNDRVVPMEKRLYVFEEVDCGAWKDVVRNRAAQKAPPVPGQGPSSTAASPDDGLAAESRLVINALLNAVSDQQQQHRLGSSPSSQDAVPFIGPREVPKPPAVTLTLADILELLDGIVEMPGRVVVFTTNYPDHLDGALMRPGRIDVNMEFKRLKRGDVADMYRLWFGEDLPAEVLEHASDHAFTQAELGEMFIAHRHDRDALFERLARREK